MVYHYLCSVKVCVLVLTINLQTSVFFLAFIFDFLEFPSVKSSKIFTAHRILRFTNFRYRVCSGSFFKFFFKFTSFTSTIFPRKKRQLKLSNHLPVYQILRNFKTGNAIAYRLYWSFRPQRTCGRKTFGSHREF